MSCSTLPHTEFHCALFCVFNFTLALVPHSAIWLKRFFFMKVKKKKTNWKSSCNRFIKKKNAHFKFYQTKVGDNNKRINFAEISIWMRCLQNWHTKCERLLYAHKYFLMKRVYFIGLNIQSNVSWCHATPYKNMISTNCCFLLLFLDWNI